MIYLLCDATYRLGGIETYLHALSLRLQRDNLRFRVVVAEIEKCDLIDDLVAKGINVYRQIRLPGDTWSIRQHVMLSWLGTQLKPGDWVFCVRQPIATIYLRLVRLVHGCSAKIAVSWMLAPEYLPPLPPHGKKYCQAVAETDVVISTAKCTIDQFKEVYGYTGHVYCVPYHSLPVFEEAIPTPSGLPWKIGFIGRLDIKQKNLDILLQAFASLIEKCQYVELHIYGRGADQAKLEAMAVDLDIEKYVTFHGGYDHRKDLPQIMRNCHFFVCPSRFEGAPLVLLEIMQAGRFCVVSRVAGIPDLYEGFPEVGLLISPDSKSELVQGMLTAIDKVASGSISPDKIRARYFDSYDMESAHKAWTSVIKVNT